ncbi:MAG: hypothetical protein WKF30_15990 [Pyrinomonadaceae bacterium]
MKIISRLPIPLLFSLVIACASFSWSQQSTAQDGAQSFAAQTSEAKKSSGAAKFFTAPFRLLGRLFGSHRKTSPEQQQQQQPRLAKDESGQKPAKSWLLKAPRSPASRRASRKPQAKNQSLRRCKNPRASSLSAGAN